MTIALVFFAHTGLVVAAVLIAGRRAWQRVSAVLILIGCFILEWFAPVDLVSRTLLTGGGMIALMATVRNASLATERWTVWQRLFHLIFLGHPMRAESAKPWLWQRALAHLVLDALVCGAAILALRHLTPAHYVSRWAVGVVLLCALGHFLLEGLPRFCFSVAGASMNTIHRTPIAASSLRDFWGRRWNCMVSGWLNTFIFLPLARRHRPGLGLCCAFLMSAAMHAWLVVGLGALAAFSMAMFFSLQSLFIWVEDHLCVKTWPAPLARAWTLIVLLGLSPLIVIQRGSLGWPMCFRRWQIRHD
jgi:hypothetical protein